MNKSLIFLVLISGLTSCSKKEKVDLLVTNANIYTVNPNFAKADAFAVKDGKFVAIGKTKDLQNNFTATKSLDAKGQTVLPGLIDAHCHFFGLGLQQQKVDLTGTKSYDDVLQKIKDFQDKKQARFITGRGWDQNDWTVKEFPTKEKLDALFPKTPVAVTRIDGHALLANQAALDLAGITDKTKVSGGEIIKENGKITGVLIDNAMDKVYAVVPNPTKSEQIQALLDAQKICTGLGLTTVDDAGLSKDNLELIDSLQKAGKLKMRIYGMVSATPDNIDYYIKKGIVKTDRLNIRSFKVYADGALGSRGAALRKPYSDKPHHYGAFVTSVEDLKSTAQKIAASTYQMNTHAIGDSANHFVLEAYTEALKNQKDRRWRVEHAQVVSPEDFKFFKNIIPSVQSTHATSDMYWAGDRLGDVRLNGAYAYKDLLKQYGKVALGTDFPVEKVNPMLTFYAAVARQDLNGYPKDGFQPENALSREETLKGMTIWAAYSNFEESEKGSIEVGKMADFIILNQDIMTVEIHKVPNTKVEATYINGEKM
jgi:predicted amidohydrolase YtcJ